jgi:hypothetical protein
VTLMQRTHGWNKRDPLTFAAPLRNGFS